MERKYRDSRADILTPVGRNHISDNVGDIHSSHVRGPEIGIDLINVHSVLNIVITILTNSRDHLLDMITDRREWALDRRLHKFDTSRRITITLLGYSKEVKSYDNSCSGSCHTVSFIKVNL